MPRVLNRKTHEIPVDAMYVGRPSKYGNPFVIGRHGTREQVIERYRDHLKSNPHLVNLARQELRGKDLVCFCSPLACHADVLLEVANEG